MNLPSILTSQQAEKIKNGSTVSQIKVRTPDFTGDTDWLNGTIQKDLTPVDIIFIRGNLFRNLFYADGKPNIDQFRYCAHVRNINTTGITGAGTTDTRLYNIIHSKRSEPFDIAPNRPPRSQAVHLVSLEHVDTLTNVGADECIALISLFRWVYLCQPPLSVNLSMIKYSQSELRSQLDPSELREVDPQIKDTPPNSYLRCSPKVLEMVETPDQSVGRNGPSQSIRQAMADRLKNGYFIVRYRVGSGEETIGLFRGALLPVYPGDAPERWPLTSNNGQDYQIFDNNLGVIDISYSSVWQLGRLLASSDVSFVSALMRIRTRSYQKGIVANGLIKAHDAIGLKTQTHFFSSLPDTIQVMKDISTPGQLASISLRSRWDRPSRELDLSVDRSSFTAGVANHVSDEDSAAGTDGIIPIQDSFAPTSVDWKTVYDWVLDHMYLAGIPTHYLLTDPSLLPPESIRFFHIDSNWMDCFIDGALSCANHTALGNEDTIRDQIKDQFNTYLNTPIFKDPSNPESGQLHTPQVPVYGFFLRSAVVSVFQDLIVEVPYNDGQNSKGKAPILVQKRFGPDILMILLDRLPDAGLIKKIKFTQPPHQQRFCVADYLSESEATYLFRKVFYNQVTSDYLDQFGPDVQFKPSDPNSVYEWKSRSINFQNLQSLLFDESFSLPDGRDYRDLSRFFLHDVLWRDNNTAPHHLTSALVDVQLNDTMKYLEILPPAIKKSGSGVQDVYQIRTPTTSAAIAAARAKLQNIADKRYDTQSASTTGTPMAVNAANVARQTISSLPPSSSGKSIATLGMQDQSIPTSQKTTTSQTTAGLFQPSSVSSTVPGNVQPKSVVKAAAAVPKQTVSTSAFIYAVYPREVAYDSVSKNPPINGFVYCDAAAPADIIFSIRQNFTVTSSDTRGEIRLRTIWLTIPIGSKASRKDPANQANKMLTESPGFAPPISAASQLRVRILSNQHWVVVTDLVTNYLSIRLIARSMKRCEPFRTCKELSFMLSGLDTGWSTDPKGIELGLGVIGVTEFYGTTDGFEQGTQGARITVDRKLGWSLMR